MSGKVRIPRRSAQLTVKRKCSGYSSGVDIQSLTSIAILLFSTDAVRSSPHPTSYRTILSVLIDPFVEVPKIGSVCIEKPTGVV
jgi:hypothetical protein